MLITITSEYDGTISKRFTEQNEIDIDVEDFLDWLGKDTEKIHNDADLIDALHEYFMDYEPINRSNCDIDWDSLDMLIEIPKNWKELLKLETNE